MIFREAVRQPELEQPVWALADEAPWAMVSTFAQIAESRPLLVGLAAAALAGLITGDRSVIARVCSVFVSLAYSSAHVQGALVGLQHRSIRCFSRTTGVATGKVWPGRTKLTRTLQTSARLLTQWEIPVYLRSERELRLQPVTQVIGRVVNCPCVQCHSAR